MKRRYKLIIIILIGTIITFIINNKKTNSNISLVAFGDSFSVALTPYKVPGTSFTDYLKDYLESKNKLDNYNYEYSKDHLTISELNNYLEDNHIGNVSKTPIKQLLIKTDLLTIAIGVDEFGDISLYKDIDEDTINKYINSYEHFLKEVRSFYHKDIIVIGLYSVYNFKQNDAIIVNNKLKILCGKYNAKFIDIMPYAINKDYYFKNDNYYMNYKVHMKIADTIKEIINK